MEAEKELRTQFGKWATNNWGKYSKTEIKGSVAQTWAEGLSETVSLPP